MNRQTLMDFLQSVQEKLREPLLPTHLINWLLSIILLGCSSNSSADINGDITCGFQQEASTCSAIYQFAIATFLISSLFVGLELRWEKLANYHRSVYLGEFVASSVLSLVFFGFFVKLANAWTNTDETTKDLVGHGNPGTTIATSLLSVGTWGVLAWLSYKGYKEDDLGGIERLTYGTYVDPVTSAYHGGESGLVYSESTDPPVP